MKRLTVFTPTYNRAHLLPRQYQGLCNQSSKNFVWLIIDDGSTDNTRQIVEQWKEEQKVEIIYFYKENGGMHTGHNVAYSMIETELNVCIDSDDYMPDNAVELILSAWDEIADKSNVAGLIGLDAEENGKIIGTKIPEHLKQGSLYELYRKYGMIGDKKLVLRTDLVKKYPPYPEYEGENLVPLGVLYLMMGHDYDFIYKNDVYCIVEYQEDGSTRNIIKQYFRSPRGFAYSRIVEQNYPLALKDSIKNSIHLISSAFIAKDLSLLKEGKKVIQNYLLIPFGLLLYFYLKLKMWQLSKK